MPASGKMLKNKAQRENRLAGIGDEQGRLPSRVKPAAVMIKCTQCQLDIRASVDPTATAAAPTPAPAASASTTVAATEAEGAEEGATTTTVAPAPAPVAAPKKKKDDLSFLDASLGPVNVKKPGKK